MSAAPYPLSAARALALHTQGLAAPHHPEQPRPTRDRIYDLVVQLGAVQIDTLHVVQRSQYLTLWSRLGQYDTADFNTLIYGSGDGQNDRRLFEYWLHAACIIPLTDFRYRLPKMLAYRQQPDSWHRRWLAEMESQQIMAHVRERIQQEGRVRTVDFKHDGEKRGSWWDWKPAKRALEILYDSGEVMIAGRHNFQRIYDLAERVLPKGVDTTPPTVEAMRRFYVERAVKAFGVCRPAHAAALAYQRQSEIKAPLAELLAEGVLQKITVETLDGSPAEMLIHRETLPALQQAAEGALTAARTTFLSPFDSLFWPKGRDEQFWGFRQVLEAYKRAPDRIWGYFCLPILHRDRLVGRFDPKLERKTGTLRLKVLYLEPGIEPDEALVSDVAGAMRDFMAFHEATDLVIERSEPASFGKKLLAALD